MVRHKTSKGCVGVTVDRGRLRLSWHYGKRIYLFLGLPESQINLAVAQGIAKKIEVDIATGNYDPTLNKYRLNPIGTPESKELIDDLLRRFWRDRSKQVTSERTKGNYLHAISNLKIFYQKEDLTIADIKDASKFLEWLKGRVSHDTLKTYLNRLRAIWNFAGIKPNPWNILIIRTEARPTPKPFTQNEVNKILAAFRETDYSDFVETLFKTGARVGEIVGLRWKNVSPNCDRITISECLTKGVRRPVKNGKTRENQLSQSVIDILQRRKKPLILGETLVFGEINMDNFRTVWIKVLKKLDIPYRKFYSTRSTFVSHALAAGMTPVDVAKITGHDVQTLFEHYAASVNQNLKLPEVF